MFFMTFSPNSAVAKYSLYDNPPSYLISLDFEDFEIL